MKEITKAYMAGIVDAEGCLEVRKHVQAWDETGNHFNYGVRITVPNDSLHLVKWICTNFGGTYKRNSSNGDKKRYRWIIQDSKHILTVLDLIKKYLILKAPQSEILEQYIGMDGIRNPAARESLFVKCQYLKSQVCVTTKTPRIFLTDRAGMRRVSKETYAYLAGFFDGDGCISVSPQTSNPEIANFQITVGNVDDFNVNWLKSLFGGGICINPPKENRQKWFQWYLNGKEKQERFLLYMIPYLKVKRAYAMAGLRFVRSLPSSAPYESHKLLFETMRKIKIESELHGDVQSDSAGTPKS